MNQRPYKYKDFQTSNPEENGLYENEYRDYNRNGEIIPYEWNYIWDETYGKNLYVKKTQDEMYLIEQLGNRSELDIYQYKNYMEWYKYKYPGRQVPKYTQTQYIDYYRNDQHTKWIKDNSEGQAANIPRAQATIIPRPQAANIPRAQGFYVDTEQNRSRGGKRKKSIGRKKSKKSIGRKK